MTLSCRCFNCWKGLPITECLNKDKLPDGVVMVSAPLLPEHKPTPELQKANAYMQSVLDDEARRLNGEANMACKLADAARDLNEANIKIVRLINLLGDIVSQATNDPAKLTAFNSPLLQLACMEIYQHNNPDEPVDERSQAIFKQMALAGFNG